MEQISIHSRLSFQCWYFISLRIVVRLTYSNYVKTENPSSLKFTQQSLIGSVFLLSNWKMKKMKGCVCLLKVKIPIFDILEWRVINDSDWWSFFTFNLVRALFTLIHLEEFEPTLVDLLFSNKSGISKKLNQVLQKS